MEKEGVWMALPIAIVRIGPRTPSGWRSCCKQQLPEAECTWFACGDDFLRAAAEPGLYAVVFLDICMAGTNGIETARRLRQADPEVLIVFVTSSPEYVWDAFPVHPSITCSNLSGGKNSCTLPPSCGGRCVVREPELEIRIARQSIQLPLRKVLYAIARTTTSLSPPRMVSTAPCAALRRSKKKSLPHGKLYELQPRRYHQHGQGAAVRGGLHRDLGRHPPAGTAEG